MGETRYNGDGIVEYILLIGIVLLSLHHPQAQCSEIMQDRRIDPETQRQIDDFIENIYLPASGVSGLGLAIVQNDGELLYTTGYGNADEARGIRHGNSTQFLIASLTKSFTATFVSKLLHEKFPDLGEAVLDTPIRKLLPQVNNTLIDRFRSEHATFRDLLSHRLCLQRVDLQVDADPIETLDELVYRTRYAESVCEIRTEAQYSNQMYVLAGELAGVLANKSFADAMQDLLNDIGMAESALLKETDDFSRMPFRAMPHYVREGVAYPFNPELVKRGVFHLPTGGIYASPNDMAKYLRFHINLGNIDGRQAVPQDVMEWLTKPGIVIPAFQYKASDDDRIINVFGYALGLMIGAYDGWEFVQHSGGFTTYTSFMSWFPGKKLGIFTTTNMGPAVGDELSPHTFIFDLLRGKENAAEMAMKMAKMKQSGKEMKQIKGQKEFGAFYKTIIEKAPRQLEIVGKYGNGSIGECEVLEKFNQETNKTEYYFAYGKWLTGWLRETEDGGGAMFQLVYDTDIIQDEYALGLNGNSTFVGFEDNDTLSVFSQARGQTMFKRGVSMGTLPPIPWAAESC